MTSPAPAPQLQVVTAPPIAKPMQFPRMNREQFLVELGRSWEVGDHLSAIGPTKRGKSTLLGDLLRQTSVFDTVIIMTPKGPDPAYRGMGHPTASWPPRRAFGEMFKILFTLIPDRHEEDGPKIWRVTIPIRKEEDWPRLAALFKKVLAEVPRRPENARNKWCIVVDESRYVCDPQILNLATQVRNGLILGRSKNVSIVNSFQAPRWIPREALDQISHALVWRNRDRDVAKRLADVAGIDPKEFLPVMANLAYHECIWVNGNTDTCAIVTAR